MLIKISETAMVVMIYAIIVIITITVIPTESMILILITMKMKSERLMFTSIYSHGFPFNVPLT